MDGIDWHDDYQMSDNKLPRVRPWPPYKKCVIKTSSSDDWFIEYYALDPHKQKLVRCKHRGGINRVKNKRTRYQLALELAEKINYMLANGMTINSTVKIRSGELKNIGLLAGIDYVLEAKKDSLRRTSMYSLNSFKNKMKEFLDLNKLASMKFASINQAFIYRFLEWLKGRHKVSNKTYNNYLTSIQTVINYLYKRDRRLFVYNPAVDIDRLETETQMHAAYSQEQMTTIRKLMIEHNEMQLLLFVSFIFYSLARPNEIEQLKVSDIDLAGNRLLVPAPTAKNKNGVYITIFPPLRDLLVEHNILKYPASWFVFSITGFPGEKQVYDKYFLKKHSRILKLAGLDKLNKKFTTYSYKHSGAINMWLSGIDVVDIQRQCRHKTLDQTMVYLRELDCFRENKNMEKIKKIL